MANLKIKIAVIILIVLFIAIATILWFKERKIIIPQLPIAIEQNLSGLIYFVSDKELTKEQYAILKAEIKDKIKNRNKTKINNTELIQWLDMLNYELKNCRMNNVTDIVDSLNACL